MKIPGFKGTGNFPFLKRDTQPPGPDSTLFKDAKGNKVKASGDVVDPSGKTVAWRDEKNPERFNVVSPQYPDARPSGNPLLPRYTPIDSSGRQYLGDGRILKPQAETIQGHFVYRNNMVADPNTSRPIATYRSQAEGASRDGFFSGTNEYIPIKKNVPLGMPGVVINPNASFGDRRVDGVTRGGDHYLPDGRLVDAQTGFIAPDRSRLDPRAPRDTSNRHIGTQQPYTANASARETPLEFGGPPPEYSSGNRPADLP